MALIAGVGVFLFSMRDRVDAPIEIVQRVEEKTAKVLVAAVDLNRGDRLGADTVKWVDWPEKALSEAYLLQDATDQEALAKAIAKSLIVTGEPILEAKIVRPDQGGMMSAILSPGMRAVTMRVTPDSASGGFILPGDRVDVYHTFPSLLNNETEFSLLLENVKVLAIDATYVESPEMSHIGGATATLEMTPNDAAFFTTARNSRGQMTLALRSAFEPKKPFAERRRTHVDVIRYGRS
ncbi:MAG: Flp pilus assembly protein CpaB [Pseudomonadota bacterium]